MKSSNWAVFIVTLTIFRSCQSSTKEGIVSYHISIIYRIKKSKTLNFMTLSKTNFQFILKNHV